MDVESKHEPRGSSAAISHQDRPASQSYQRRIFHRLNVKHPQWMGRVVRSTRRLVFDELSPDGRDGPVTNGTAGSATVGTLDRASGTSTDITTRRPKAVNLLSMPTELLLEITHYLTIVSEACFVLTCRTVLDALGNASWSELSRKENQRHRRRFQTLLLRDLKNMKACHSCRFLHPYPPPASDSLTNRSSRRRKSNYEFFTFEAEYSLTGAQVLHESRFITGLCFIGERCLWRLSKRGQIAPPKPQHAEEPALAPLRYAITPVVNSETVQLRSLYIWQDVVPANVARLQKWLADSTEPTCKHLPWFNWFAELLRASMETEWPLRCMKFYDSFCACKVSYAGEAHLIRCTCRGQSSEQGDRDCYRCCGTGYTYIVIIISDERLSWYPPPYPPSTILRKRSYKAQQNLGKESMGKESLGKESLGKESLGKENRLRCQWDSYEAMCDRLPLLWQEADNAPLPRCIGSLRNSTLE